MTDKPSELLSAIGYNESKVLFAVYNEAEYDRILAACEALEQRGEGLEGAVKRAFTQLDIEPEWGWQYVVEALAKERT